MSGKLELRNYVINSIAHKAFDPNELLRLINLLPDELQLNENQKIVLEWLKDAFRDSDFKSVMHRFYFNLIHADAYDFYYANGCGWIKAYEKLSNDEFAQVLEVFSSWAQEQEEE